MLSAFRDNPSDSYLLRVGYGGTSGPLSNINQEGYGACAMHSWPEHLFWDGYSGDYGPNFVGMTLGSGTYLSDDGDVGLSVFGGMLNIVGNVATVTVRDPVRQKIFIGPLGIEIRIDAGVIESFAYDQNTKAISVKLGQLKDAPTAKAAIVWVSAMSSADNVSKAAQYKVSANEKRLESERQGTKVPLSSEGAQFQIQVS